MQALLGRWGLACLLATWLEEPPGAWAPEGIVTHSAAPSPRREAFFEEDPFSYLFSGLSLSTLGVAWASVPHPAGSTHLSLLMGLRGRCPSLKILERELRELTLPSPWDP